MPESAARVLVTGANGNLGRCLFRELGGGAQRFRAAVRSERARAQIEQLPQPVRPEIQLVDYGDVERMSAVATGCEGVVHLVGILKEGGGATYADAHERSCQVLADAAARAGCQRIVYMSIVGSRPDSPNACLASKGRAEQILFGGEVPATVLRVPMVLGRGDIAAGALRGQAHAGLLPLIGGGRTLQQPIDARDVVAAIAAALARPELAGEALDLGGPECLPHRELVARAARLVGGNPRPVPVPLALVSAFARVVGALSANPPITAPMLGVLQHDDRVDSEAAAQRLGIALRPLDETLAWCLGDAQGEAS